nr:helix-turn-helix domain-containing protein [Streptomyces sp. NBC_00830]
MRWLSRARKAPRDLVLRARMVELSWSGQRVPAIVDELRCSPKTVRRWLHRFNPVGLVTGHPSAAWTTQQARQLMWQLGNCAADFTYLVRDREVHGNLRRGLLQRGDHCDQDPSA